MAYLVPTTYEEEKNEDYSVDCWMMYTGPFGVSGFCLDGTEVGNYCNLCEMETTNSQNRTHFEMKRHCQKVKALRGNKPKFIIEPSTGKDMEDPDNLFLVNHCKVCNAELNTPDQQESHYMSEKHQKKVRNYFLVKIGIRERKPEAEDEDVLKKKSKAEYCSLCKIELSAPVVAQAHYAGKKHAKKLREQMDVEASGDHRIKLKSEDKETILKRKEEIKTMLQEEDAKRACLTEKLNEIKMMEEMQE